jgi:hypothetical protein
MRLAAFCLSSILFGLTIPFLALAQTTDSPPFGSLDQAVNASNGSTTLPQGSNLNASGWAADFEDGSPVARVEIWIDGLRVGNATLGGSRPDVASAYHDPRYTNSGWSFTYNIGNLAPGSHTVTAVAFDSAGANTTLTPYNGAGPITVTTDSPPFGYLDQAVNASNGSTTLPQGSNLNASGWAADFEDGSPVARVEIRIDGLRVGNATLGGSRPDVASAWHDPRYTNSGWSFTYNIGNLALGSHTVTAVAFDSAGASTTLTPYNGAGPITVI